MCHNFLKGRVKFHFHAPRPKVLSNLSLSPSPWLVFGLILILTPTVPEGTINQLANSKDNFIGRHLFCLRILLWVDLLFSFFGRMSSLWTILSSITKFSKGMQEENEKRFPKEHFFYIFTLIEKSVCLFVAWLVCWSVYL